jgi:hypothetical protein
MTVVQFKKLISATKNPGTQSKKRAAPKPASDAALIRECVVFAQNVAAEEAGFIADPTDSEYASKMGNPFCRRYNEALHKMGKLSAKTAEGLQAKARVIPIVIRNAIGSPDEREDAFFTRFGADVKAFLDPIILEHHKTTIAAKHAASAKPQAR